MKFKLQDYALIAEIIGAFAVVVSLVYVGYGVRQNTAAVQVANHQAIVAMDMQKNSSVRDPVFAEIHVRATQDFNKLTEVEKVQYFSFVADVLNAWEFAYITFIDGKMVDTIWTGYDQFYRSHLSQKSYQEFWRDNKQYFSPKFRAYVDSIFEKQKA
jgi:hypothetical protein